MRINLDKCIGCMECIPYCPAGAVVATGDKCIVDEDKCVECYACLRAKICPVAALQKVPLEWPRILRHVFSSVPAVYEELGIYGGRGSEGMNTNDITGRFHHGEVGFIVDVGRPGVGTTFEDVEKISLAVAKVGVEFEQINPVTKLMTDKNTGRLRDDIKGERIRSCELEFKAKDTKLLPIINALKEVSKLVNTVFSVGCVSRCAPDSTIPVKTILEEAGISYRPNGKTNIGFGRPLAQ